MVAAAAVCLGGCAAKAPTVKPKGGFWERTVAGTSAGAKKTWTSIKKVPGIFKRSGGRGSKVVGSELEMALTLEPAAIRLPETRSVQATFTVTNRSKRFVQLEFPTSQRIEVLVKNEAGRVLSRWSDDQRIVREAGFVSINPNERVEYTAAISTRDFRPGQTYYIEVYLPVFDTQRASRTVVPQ